MKIEDEVKLLFQEQHKLRERNYTLASDIVGLKLQVGGIDMLEKSVTEQGISIALLKQMAETQVEAEKGRWVKLSVIIALLVPLASFIGGAVWKIAEWYFVRKG